jgi:hypothetical protein
MCTQIAKNGRGSCNLVQDDEDNLKGLVISALANASEPSLQNCKFVWNNRITVLGEVFRNKLMTEVDIISKEEFASFKVAFQSDKDPVTGAPVNLEFKSEHFEKVPVDFGLFKLAGNKNIEKVSGQAKIDASIKYQVLCDQTAFVGVVKQKDKASGEMKEFAVEFGKTVH